MRSLSAAPSPIFHLLRCSLPLPSRRIRRLTLAHPKSKPPSPSPSPIQSPNRPTVPLRGRLFEGSGGASPWLSRHGMSLVLHFSLLRNNIRSTNPIRLLKQHAGFLSEKLFGPRSYEKQHFTTSVQTLETKFTGVTSLPKPGSGSCIPGIQSLWPQQTSEVDQRGTVLVFDVETTGYLHQDHRIIEIAVRDLSGGKNCTFETLINPERNVPKSVSTLTNIDTDLVCRPDIPRFSDVLPILLAYIRSRQVPGKPILWVAHNAKNFDVPFLAEEFRRCSAEIPADWIFVDSLSLARKSAKSEVKVAGEKRRPVNLEALRKHYGIHSRETAHRAMRDVTILCQIFQKITFDLKLTYEGLRNESVRACDCRKLS